MSGIEVAGLVLGVIPILISGLEQWRKSAEVVSDWWQIQKEYKKCTRELKCADLELTTSLERFLLPLLIDDDEIRLLMDEPGGPRWQNPDLEDTLKQRLPKSYSLFVEVIEDINEVVQKIRLEIGLENSVFEGAVTDTQLSGRMQKLGLWGQQAKSHSRAFAKQITAQAQRVRFALRRPDREKLFEELDGHNKRLRRLLDTNDTSQRLRQDRDHNRASKVSDGIFSMWQHAEKMYQLLLRAFRCNHKGLHYLYLRLAHVTKCDSVEFRLLISESGEAEHPKSKPLIARKVESMVRSSLVQSEQKSVQVKTNRPSKSALRASRAVLDEGFVQSTDKRALLESKKVREPEQRPQFEQHHRD